MKHKILFFSISMILLVLTAIFFYVGSHPQQFEFGPFLRAEKLSVKPEKYIVVTDPDPYLLEAFSHPGTDVFLGSWDNTIVYELLKSYHYQIFDVEYGGAYYTVHLGSLDTAYPVPWPILLIGWIGLGVGFIISHVRAKEIKNLSSSS